MRKRLKTSPNFKLVAICAALVIATLSFMTVGFARYNRILDIAGDIDLKPQGKVYISNAVFLDGKNVSSDPKFTDTTVDFGLKIFASQNQTEYYANYEVTLTNDTFYDQTISVDYWETQFANNRGDPVDGITAEYELSGIKNGDIIKHGDSLKFNVRIVFATTRTGNFNVTSGIEVNFSETNKGFLLAYVKEPLTGDLRSPNTSAAFTIHVANSFSYAKIFDLSLVNNPKFTMSPAPGQSLSDITIPANSEADYIVYVSVNGVQDFPSVYERATINMTSSGSDMNAGRITLYVDQSIIYTDHESPQISNVKLTALNAEGEAQVTWDATDDVTIKDFTVQIVDASGNIVQTKTTTDDTTTISFQGLEAGEYYARVYGEDSLGNIATADQIAACSTAAGACSRSDTVNLLWRYAITEHLMQVIKSSGESTVVRGETYSAKYTTSNPFRSLPNTITVKMGGRELVAGTDYTWSKNTGSLSVPNVSGDLDITIQSVAGCLTAGTQILLADGTTKAIENITYNDLLAVWNHETGQLDAEYPIWIEQEHQTVSYRKIQFSDGSELKTVMNHGVFDVDKNLFVSVADREFTPGTNVYKLVDGKLQSVRVESISIVHETVKYYHVVSSRYFNVIANGIVTTDGTVATSNLFGFTDNLRWPEQRYAYLAQPNSTYDYDKFADTVPEYMFVGARIGEIKLLIDAGYLGLDDFKDYLRTNQVSPIMWRHPESRVIANDLQNFDTKRPLVPNSVGRQHVWPVSFGDFKTSIIEGREVILTNRPDVKFWRNSIDGKLYHPGDRVKIMCGTHFAPVK